MATNYTSLLGFALPTTGELAGTWGTVVNDSITQLVEDSVAGVASVSVTSGNVTLTTTGSGAANQARCAIIIATGTPGTARNIIAPSQSKAYIVINQSDSNVTFKGAATTGHVLKPGDANLLAWNGSDFQDIEQGDVGGPASATDNAVVRFDGTSGKLIQNSAVTIADTSGDIQTSGNIIVGDGTASLPSITNVGDTNTGIYFPDADTIAFAEGGTEAMRITSTGEVLVGGTTAVISGKGAVTIEGTDTTAYLSLFRNDTSIDSGNALGQIRFYGNDTTTNTPTSLAYVYAVASGTHAAGDNPTDLTFGTTPDGSATVAERMRLDQAGNLGLGVTPSAWNLSGFVAEQIKNASLGGYLNRMYLSANAYHNGTNWIYIATDTAGQYSINTSGEHQWYTAVSGTAGNAITWSQTLTITNAGFTQPLAYADTVVALGNTGTSKTIDLKTGNVFTATLTGNCTFTLSNPIATGSSSFTLILTNDGTAGRTVAWSGGSFVFPGGAATLSRTTTANAVDVWVFFTPNGGTTWYGNIAMKDMKA